MAGWSIWVMGLMLAGVIGCRGSHTANPTAPSDATTQQNRSAEVVSDPPARTEDPTQTRETTAAGLSEQIAVAPKPAEKQQSAIRDTRFSQIPAERLLLLTPEGPVVVELRVVIDGRHFAEVRRKHLEQMLQWFDRNGNQQTEWSELLASPLVRSGELGNNPISMNQNDASILRQFDRDRNRAVDLNEMARFFSAGTMGAKPMTVSASFASPASALEASPTFRLLDIDQDRRILADEWMDAAIRLRAMDWNADDVLDPSELAVQADSSPGMMSTSAGRQREAAFVITKRKSWMQVLFALEDTYAVGGGLTPDTLAYPENLFAQLDADSSQYLMEDELERLKTIPPHLELVIVFQSPDQATESVGQIRPTPTLTLVTQRLGIEEKTNARQTAESRLAISLHQSPLSFSVQPWLGGGSAKTLAEELIKRYDENEDGVLEESEVAGEPALPARWWEEIDRNQDHQLDVDEVAGYLRVQRGVSAYRIQVEVGESWDALFAALDTSRDGRLSTREIDQCQHRIKTLDRNSDGQVASEEIVPGVTVSLSLGDALRGMNVIIPPDASVASTEPQDRPAWFSAMDANGDGEISRGEFLGDTATFEQLDRDGDQLIESGEIPPAAAVPEESAHTPPAAKKTSATKKTSGS